MKISKKENKYNEIISFKYIERSALSEPFSNPHY